MKLKIEIEMDNAAFADEPDLEVAEILAKMARFINLDRPDRINLHDSNGNTVGKAEVTP